MHFLMPLPTTLSEVYPVMMFMLTAFVTGATLDTFMDFKIEAKKEKKPLKTRTVENVWLFLGVLIIYCKTISMISYPTFK